MMNKYNRKIIASVCNEQVQKEPQLNQRKPFPVGLTITALSVCVRVFRGERAISHIWKAD